MGDQRLPRLLRDARPTGQLVTAFDDLGKASAARKGNGDIGVEADSRSDARLPGDSPERGSTFDAR